jgi:hypothetical protein
MILYILVGRYQGFWSAYCLQLLIYTLKMEARTDQFVSYSQEVPSLDVGCYWHELNYDRLPSIFSVTWPSWSSFHLTWRCVSRVIVTRRQSEVYCLWHQSICFQLRTVCSGGPFIGSHALDDFWASFVVVAVAHSLILRWEVTVPSRRFLTYWMRQIAGVEGTSTGGNGWVQLAVKCIAHRWSTPILRTIRRLA